MKTPWIEYNGQAMGDSGLIMEFLNREKGVDLNRTLSDADKAVSRAFTKMVEENTYWYDGCCQYSKLHFRVAGVVQWLAALPLELPV